MRDRLSNIWRRARRLLGFYFLMLLFFIIMSSLVFAFLPGSSGFRLALEFYYLPIAAVLSVLLTIGIARRSRKLIKWVVTIMLALVTLVWLIVLIFP